MNDFEQFAVLVEAYGRMLGALDPAALLPAILDQSCRLLTADAYAVWRHHPPTNSWRILTASGLSEEFCNTDAAVIPTTTNASGYGVVTEPICVEDTHVDISRPSLKGRRERYEKEGIRALLIVPLLFHGESSATLVFYHRAPHKFVDTEIRLATSFAGLVASALTSAELYQAEQKAKAEAEEANREAQLLYETAKLLGRTLDLNVIYETVRSLVASRMSCDSLLVSEFNRETNLITSTYAWTEGKSLNCADLPPVPLAPEGMGMQSVVIHSGEPLLIADTLERLPQSRTVYNVEPDGTVQSVVSSQPSSEPVKEAAYSLPRSLLLIPIKLEEEVLGVFQIQSYQPNAYTKDDLRILEAIVVQMAAASRNAVLYQTAQGEIAERKRAEEELLQKQTYIEELNERLQRSVVETHHRVKNNLQIMTAMVDLQVLEGTETVPVTELKRLGTHIRTLAAVHDLLTGQARTGAEAETISSQGLLEKLLSQIQRTLQERWLRFHIEDTRLSSRQGTSLALITNELISNALKHSGGEVEIRFEVAREACRLIVCDEGPGFPDGFDPLQAANTGLELVENLCRWDLQGTSAYENQDGGGARVVIEMVSSHAVGQVPGQGEPGMDKQAAQKREEAIAPPPK